MGSFASLRMIEEGRSEVANLFKIRRGGIPEMHRYYVYIMSSPTGTLYTGMTNDLMRRVHQHQQKLVDGFTKKYNITRLIYFEETGEVNAAILREKQIKSWGRSKKLALVRSINPTFQDLSEGWFGEE